MPTLTKAAFFTKKFLTVFAIVLILVIGYFSFRTVGKNILNSILPQPPDPALIAFGKLPAVDLSEGLKPPPDVTYEIETITGKLPTLASKLKVFSVKQPVAAFGDTNKANSIAQALQFNLPPVVVTTSRASYVDDVGRILDVQLTTSELKLSSDYINNQKVITSNPKADDLSSKMAEDFITRITMDRTLFPQDKVQVIKYKVDDGKLVKAQSLSGANLAQVNYNRADIDKVPLIPPRLDVPKVRVLVSSEEIVFANFSVTNIEKYRFSTYPLKGVQKAFDELNAGKAIYNDELEGNTFSIRDVTLGYLDPEKSGIYLQPVYIFKSDEGLAAFVPAVSDEHIQGTQNI